MALFFAVSVFGRLHARGPGRLLYGRVLRHLPASLFHLLVALAACSRAGHEADGEPREERRLESHLAPLSRMFVMLQT